MASIVAKLLKTNLEKMSEFPLSTMLMKTSQLYSSFHDLDDKKESYKKTRFANHLPRSVYTEAKCTPVRTVRGAEVPARLVGRFRSEQRPARGQNSEQASLTETGEMAYGLHDFDGDRHHPGNTLRRFQQSLA